MVKKAPRRTAQRIATVSLDLFNRYGEPNVSTTLISSELNISPGNLYYHFPAKDQLVSHLFDNYKTDILKLLEASQDVKDVEDAWFFQTHLRSENFILAPVATSFGQRRPHSQRARDFHHPVGQHVGGCDLLAQL